jgi:hypothetical protein
MIYRPPEGDRNKRQAESFLLDGALAPHQTDNIPLLTFCHGL